MTPPRVTFVIPCYNHGRFVAHAARSCLEQHNADARVVIVDDGSDDGTTPDQCDALADGDRVTVIHQQNRGLPGARNRGAQGTQTEYLAFLDADDWVEPTFAATLHEALTRAGRDGDAPVSHAYCQERLVELGAGVWRVPEWDPILLMVTNLHPVTCLVRRDRFEESGGFDKSMRGGYEDWDLWLRFASRGWRGVRVPEPLFVWRRHSPDTMIMRAVENHDRLYARLVENNRGFYEAHMERVMLLANSLLRRADANWLDENLEARTLRGIRELADAAVKERDILRVEVERTNEQLRMLREHYESKPAVRASSAFHRAVESLPRPIAAPAAAVLRALKRIVPGGR